MIGLTASNNQYKSDERGENVSKDTFLKHLRTSAVSMCNYNSPEHLVRYLVIGNSILLRTSANWDKAKLASGG